MKCYLQAKVEMMKNYLYQFTLILLMLNSHAQGATTFGAEFTFTNAAIQGAQGQGNEVNNSQSEDHRDRMAEQVLKTCGDCRLVREQNAYGIEVIRVIYPDKFFFVIATDPSCVEIQTKPLTVKMIEKYLLRLQRDVFDAALEVGMKPSSKIGGGHIHFGWQSSTGGDLLLTRNIIVDFANHPELANGVFGIGVVNTPPLNRLPADRQAAFKRIINDVDTRKIRSPHVLAKRIQNEVYSWHPYDWPVPEKYRDLNITRIASPQYWNPNEITFEARLFSAQNSALEYLRETQLLDGRLKFLAKNESAVAVNIPSQYSSITDLYKNFAQYTFEAGMDFEKFRTEVKLLNSNVAASTPAFTLPSFGINKCSLLF